MWSVDNLKLTNVGSRFKVVFDFHTTRLGREASEDLTPVELSDERQQLQRELMLSDRCGLAARDKLIRLVFDPSKKVRERWLKCLLADRFCTQVTEKLVSRKRGAVFQAERHD